MIEHENLRGCAGKNCEKYACNSMYPPVLKGHFHIQSGQSRASEEKVSDNL